MSLLWFDSLDYATTDNLIRSYGSASGFSVGAPHPIPYRTGVQVTFGALTIPISNPNSNPGSDVCLLGFLLGSDDLPASRTEIAVIFAPNLSAQLRVFLLPEGNGARIELWSGDSRQRILLSSVLDLATMRYIEFEVRVSASGRAKLRVDGVTDAVVDSVDTASVVGSSWHSVQFSVTSSTGGHIRLADLYLASGENEFKLLGPSVAMQAWPRETTPRSRSNWSITPKKRLVLMLGQSNMNGRGLNPYTGNPRSPNSSVKVWNTNTSSFEDLEANVNSGNAFLAGTGNFGLLWGPEMSFAESVAQLFERASHADSQVFIVKMAADGSWVNGVLNGVPTWSPSVPGNLSDSVLSQLATAVASQGGWGEFDSVDIFWYQGESEGLTFSFPSPRTLYLDDTNIVFDHIEAGIPVDVHWHRTVIHSGIAPFFTGIQSVINMQRGGSLRGTVIETSDLQMGADGLHLSETAFEALGERYFASWLARVQSEVLIQDYLTGNPDDEGIESDTTNLPLISFSQDPSLMQDMLHLPASALSSKIVLESTPGSLSVSVGGTALPNVTLVNNPSAVFDLNIREGFVSPETATGDVDFGVSP